MNYQNRHFTPQYDQPITLAELSTLEPELLINEISRLENSLKHLIRSNEELQEFLNQDDQDDDDDDETRAEFVNTVFENQETIKKQEERIQMIRIALEEQIGVQATNSHYSTTTSTTSSNLTPSTSTTTRNEEEEVTGMAGAVSRIQVGRPERVDSAGVVVETNGTVREEEAEEEATNGMYL